MKITKRNPLLSIVNDFQIDSPAASNISYFWSFGSLLGLNLVLMIITGIQQAMHYTANTEQAFNSVEHITRDVNYGWLQRFAHANGASFFFIWVYIHIGRGLYYGSYRSPRTLLWVVGVIIFIVMMAMFYWPSWYIIKQYGNEVHSENLQYLISVKSTSIIPFSKSKTHAIKRIGPHDYDVIAIIVISQLGDAWMDRISSKQRFSYRFNMDQEAGKNTEYIFWQAKYFYDRGYCESPTPKKITRTISNKDRTGSKTRTIYRISLFTHTSFHWIYNSFYVWKGKRVKVVPEWIGDYQNPLTQANWIMQDGSRQKGQGVYIATNNFTYEECEFLANLINTRLRLTTSVISAGFPDQWRISIWKDSMPHLRQIVKDHIIGEMDRKIR